MAVSPVRQGRSERSVLGTRANEDAAWRRLTVISEINFCTALNSGVPARSSSSNSAASTVADDRARALQPLQAALVVDLMARAHGVRGHVHLDASVEQVVDGLADAHVRLDPTHDRLRAPAQVEPVGARGD